MITTRIQIRWNDIDSLGHVYNGQYQQYFDLGKSDYFKEVLHMDTNWMTTGRGTITASTTTNYFAPTILQEPIEIQSEIESIGTKSMVFMQRMVNIETRQLKAESRSVHVGYNPITQQSFVISDEWREMIAQYQKNPQFLKVTESSRE